MTLHTRKPQLCREHMKLPRDINGATLVKLLVREYGYRRVNQVGSHIILETNHPRSHRVAVPNHSAVRIGTLNSILRAVAAVQQVDRQDILDQL